jgi:hypothetical protein
MATIAPELNSEPEVELTPLAAIPGDEPPADESATGPSADAAAEPSADASANPKADFKSMGSSNFQYNSAMCVINEIDKHSLFCGTYPAWSLATVPCAPSDCVKFTWLQKDSVFTIKGPKTDEKFDDVNNDRWFSWTFEKTGIYTVTVTKSDQKKTKFTCKVKVESESQAMTKMMISNVLYFVVLIGGLVAISLGARWFLQSTYSVRSPTRTAQLTSITH